GCRSPAGPRPAPPGARGSSPGRPQAPRGSSARPPPGASRRGFSGPALMNLLGPLLALLSAMRFHRARMINGSEGAARVLVVDDEPAVRSSLGRALRLEDYSVELVEDGQQALDRLAVGGYDVVVLDVS